MTFRSLLLLITYVCNRITLKGSQAKKLLNKSFFIICVYLSHIFASDKHFLLIFRFSYLRCLSSCMCQVWTSLNYNHIRFLTVWLLVEYKLQGYYHVIIISLSTTVTSFIFSVSVLKYTKMMMISVVLCEQKEVILYMK